MKQQLLLVDISQSCLLSPDSYMNAGIMKWHSVAYKCINVYEELEV
jgi:hypothetical protein